MPRSRKRPPFDDALSAWDRLRRPVWLFEPVAFVGLYANAAALELWGAETLDELLARDFTRLSDAVQTRLRRLAQATAGGESVTERWSFYPQGRPTTVQAVISSFALEDGRTALLFEAAPIDATSEELRAVEALRHTSTLISLFDGAGKTAFANPAAFAAYGDAGVGFADRFTDPAEGADALTRVLAGEVFAELRQVRSDSGERWRHLDARTVVDPVTGNAGVLLSERDVTAQVEAERALAAAHERAEVAEAKQRFLANISHELRTPLTAITGFAALLGAGPLPETERGHVARIAEAGERLTGILNDVIDLSELDRGDVRLDLAPFDPVALASEALAAMGAAAEAKRLTLHLDVAADMPDVVGDAARLGRVLFQLIDNAVKFTQRGGVTLRLEAADVDGRAELTFSVVDTGPGLDAATQSRLFRRFSQADDGLRKSVAGGGLGLAIVKETLALMDGAVGIESEPGAGARFWFRVTLDRAEASDAADAPPESIDADETPWRVLYADDHESNRMLVQAVLQSQGVACDLVNDGAEAVSAVAAGAYDLILMDIQMPVLDGVSATREIRKAGGRQVPILALTANTLAEQRTEYAAAGMQDCLAKPVNMAELLGKTAEWAAAGRAGWRPAVAA